MQEMILFLKKLFAFVKRDFQTEISYRISFLLQVFGIFINVSVFFFLSKLLGTAQMPQLAEYGGDYFAFVLIGIAFNYYLSVSQNSLSQSIREGQIMGTLEALLVTQTEIPTIIISSSVYSFLFTTVRVIIFIIIGVFVYGLDLSRANYAGAVVILLISIIAFSSFGILSASFVMVLKKGDPVASIFNGISWLLGGVYYPVSILPSWLKPFCIFFSHHVFIGRDAPCPDQRLVVLQSSTQHIFFAPFYRNTHARQHLFFPVCHSSGKA